MCLLSDSDNHQPPITCREVSLGRGGVASMIVLSEGLGSWSWGGNPKEKQSKTIFTFLLVEQVRSFIEWIFGEHNTKSHFNFLNTFFSRKSC